MLLFNTPCKYQKSTSFLIFWGGYRKETLDWNRSILDILSSAEFNPLSANPTKWSNTLEHIKVADKKLLELSKKRKNSGRVVTSLHVIIVIANLSKTSFFRVWWKSLSFSLFLAKRLLFACAYHWFWKNVKVCLFTVYSNSRKKS